VLAEAIAAREDSDMICDGSVRKNKSGRIKSTIPAEVQIENRSFGFILSYLA